MRWYSSGVVLPTGEVVALSGADKDEVVEPGAGERDPQSRTMGPGHREGVPLGGGGARSHLSNSAVLLPDRSILVGGHSPILGYGKGSLDH